MLCASTGTHTHCPQGHNLSFIQYLLTQVRSYIRVRDGVSHEVSAHDRGTSSGWTQHKRNHQAPKRSDEERKALRLKFARHRLPRS